ncbi:iron ABC transporter permease [Pseudonocardia parietis]|uniref:ABC-type Fe3+-siderophore transport system permease subunit n=1 Tax=Pseudonocardia parietis TaxID=570936 RepID=A0ABS4W6A5_9PSEU|nr:iron ABC transporter permease [Pseudonocardia parietis]MBP2371744.1 ABC-type Fe3+-siderophore transport system permease subunit [Pseudonocardia parietis]
MAGARPRVLLGIVVGAALALCGAILQTPGGD